MAYYELHCFSRLFTDVLELGEIPQFDHVESRMSGQPLPAPVPEPVVIPIEDDGPGEPLEMYELEALIMSGKLLRQLKSAGVDNLEAFRAILRGDNGRTIDDYFIVNVVGAIACANLEESEYDPPTGRATINVWFDRLVIDEDRAGNTKLFRLGENLGTILVHEDVKRHLEDGGFHMLTFREVPSSVTR